MRTTRRLAGTPGNIRHAEVPSGSGAVDRTITTDLLMFTAAALILLRSSPAMGQGCVTPKDDLMVPSDTTLTLCPGAYELTDTLSDGVLRIENVHDVTIEGTGVTLHGPGAKGYALLVKNSSRVTIRNFSAITGFFYAIRVEQSDSVTITNCTAKDNARVDAGFIDVWSDVNQAHGGGVLFDRSRNGAVSHCAFTTSNDGAALYHCSGMTIAHNDLSRNTAYAIRMFYTDSSVISGNNGSHTYRENPVNSDAGALLMIISNSNRVEGNDFTYSSDGVFLGQYGHSQTPNNNLFLDNDCSFSPHNAFEATFASGNIFRKNKANYSGYGFWLGYSSRTIVDSNEIIGNREQLSVGTAGIAIDRGYNTVIRHNRIEDNATGILLWRGDPIPGYEGQLSEGYTIADNAFSGNVRAVDVSGTDELDLRTNVFARNYEAVILGAGDASTTISGNRFGPTVMAWISNGAPSAVDATGNVFPLADTALIRAKIYDAEDNPQVGPVVFIPFDVMAGGGLETVAPEELTEPAGGTWSVFASDGARSQAVWDTAMKFSGRASLRVATESGWDVNIHRWPVSALATLWDLQEKTTLGFWVYALNSNEGQFQNYSVRLGNDSGGYLELSTSSDLLSSAIGQWKRMEVPLEGNALWRRSAVGRVRPDSIAYVELHADTWGGGFTLWIDGMSFLPLTSIDADSPALPIVPSLSQNYPNPFNPLTIIKYTVGRVEGRGTRDEGRGTTEAGAGNVRLVVYDLLGREVATLVNEMKEPGEYEVSFSASSGSASGTDGSGLASGVYIYRLTAGSFTQSRKMVLLK